MRVTALEHEPRRNQVDLYLDGQHALTLSVQVLGSSGLRVGDEIDDERLEGLRQAEIRQAALSYALSLLSRRSRTRGEMRQRLALRTIPAAVIDETLSRLQEISLLDDDAFARSWIAMRNRTSPRGRRLYAVELRARGIERATILDSIEDLDEADAAYRAALKRARSYASLPGPEFRRRLGMFLLRRGFDYETAGQTVDRLWEERTVGGSEGA